MKDVSEIAKIRKELDNLKMIALNLVEFFERLKDEV